MKIQQIVIYVQQGEATRRQTSVHGGSIDLIPPGLSGRFTHSSGFGGPLAVEAPVYVADEEGPTYNATLRLVTDGDLDAFTRFGGGFSAEELLWQGRQFAAAIAPLLLGVDAFDREYVWQRLWYAQRFFYTGRQVLDMVDRMLWDLASRWAQLPIYKLLGAARERVPAYRNIGGATIDALVTDGVASKDEGFLGCKDHSYRGVKGNTELGEALRDAVGDDYILLHDPVESYTYPEAVQIGRQLERLNYRWIEEPLQDYDIMGLRKLCASLDLPVLTLEWIGAIGGQPFNTAPYLALQAADIVRQRGIGITGQIKQAQLAESFGAEVHGGDPQVILAVANDPLFETTGDLVRAAREGSTRPHDDELDCRGRPFIEDGHLQIAWKPVRPEEPDWERMAGDAVHVVRWPEG
jgi:L-alanine-DL-glutamate epimerase-like enolase superfamily enzyme